jgi:hypothetical protein
MGLRHRRGRVCNAFKAEQKELRKLMFGWLFRVARNDGLR